MHAITMCTNTHFVEFTITLTTIFNKCMIKTKSQYHHKKRLLSFIIIGKQA